MDPQKQQCLDDLAKCEWGHGLIARVAELEKLREAIEGQAAQAPTSISIRVRYALNQCNPKG